MFSTTCAAKNEFITTVSVQITGSYRGESHNYTFWKDFPTADVERLIAWTVLKIEQTEWRSSVVFLLCDWEPLAHLCDIK